jgi:hypothetical protein
MGIRPYGSWLGQKIQPRDPRHKPAELVPIVSARINSGMITTIDAEDIQDSALTSALNTRIRFDKTSRRRGTESFGDTPPDAFKILALYNFKDNAGVGTLIRFTKDGLYSDPASWTAITGTLTGSDSDRFNIAVAFNKIVFSNSGIDPIQVINLAGPSFTDLGDAPNYKYVTVFANRVVGANNATTGFENPIEVGWSGDGNITVWDSMTDQSAGSGPLIESPGDTADFITGVFGFTNVLIVLRERSLWVATKQPIAEAPFNFYADIPGIGCNCPYSAAVIPGGLVFADHRTQKIYVYSPGQQPTSISTNVELGLFAAISDPLQVFGSYDNRNNEYALAVPLVGSSVVRVWIFNFRTQAWSYDERLNLSCISDIEGAAQELVIDDLVGTIDDLTGTIDGLVGAVSQATSRLYGFSDGTLQIERASANTDNGINFDVEIISKTFALPITDQYISRMTYKIFARQPTTITLYYSKDGGKTWVLARVDTINNTYEPSLIEWNKQIKCKYFSWKMVSSTGDWDLIEYELHAYRSGTSRADSQV